MPRLETSAKNPSIPGSITQAGDSLFGKDDIQNAAMVGKVNAAGRSFATFRGGGKSYRFRGYSGTTQLEKK